MPAISLVDAMKALAAAKKLMTSTSTPAPTSAAPPILIKFTKTTKTVLKTMVDTSSTSSSSTMVTSSTTTTSNDEIVAHLDIFQYQPATISPNQPGYGWLEANLNTLINSCVLFIIFIAAVVWLIRSLCKKIQASRRIVENEPKETCQQPFGHDLTQASTRASVSSLETIYNRDGFTAISLTAKQK